MPALAKGLGKAGKGKGKEKSKGKGFKGGKKGKGSYGRFHDLRDQRRHDLLRPGSKRDGFSVGIFGEAGALDWTGRGARSGGGAEAGSRDGVSARAQTARKFCCCCRGRDASGAGSNAAVPGGGGPPQKLSVL